MSINRKPSSADMLKRALADTPRRAPADIGDEFAKGVARRLELRGITEVPGLPEKPEESTWEDRFLEYVRRTQELEEKWAADRQAEQEAQYVTQTTADLIRSAMAETYRPSSRSDMPLNGPAILRAAGGTPDGGSSWARDSVASLLRGGLIH
ncbi:hypothetical protein [Nocardia sp. R6R-6]|uniref:hypothetical protein n=1 Tax=Nocardia sp. R6R-6 TaxID=3459303 RepID=UPI00403DCAB7